MGLDELRARLDGIDNQMLDLLSKRAQVILQVADFKQQHRLPAHVPDREAAIVERLRTTNPGPLSASAIERIYRTVIEEMRKFEEQYVTSGPTI